MWKPDWNKNIEKQARPAIFQSQGHVKNGLPLYLASLIQRWICSSTDPLWRCVKVIKMNIVMYAMRTSTIM